MSTLEYLQGLQIAAIETKNFRTYPYSFIYRDQWYEARSEDVIVPIKLGEEKPRTQLDAVGALPWVLGQFVGLQKNPEVKAIIVKRLGSEEAYEQLAESLFKIALEFYP